MKNMKCEVTEKGKKLIITVDLTKNQGKSKSGKSILIATSEGNQSVPGLKDTKIGLNIYKTAASNDDDDE